MRICQSHRVLLHSLLYSLSFKGIRTSISLFRLSLPEARYVIRFFQLVMYSGCSLFGMTFTRQLRGFIAHDGPAPAAWRYLPCTLYPNIFCWRIRGSASVPR